MWDIIYDRSQPHGVFYRSIDGAAWTIWGWSSKRAKTAVGIHEMSDRYTHDKVFPKMMSYPYKMKDIRQVVVPLDEIELGDQTDCILQIMN